MEQINKCLEGLKIQPNEKYNEEQEKYVVGRIYNVIQTLDTVLVKPHSSDILLYFGSPLFLSCTNYPGYESGYILLGYIDDIFGSIAEPMYSVIVKCDLTKNLNIDTPVYYFPNDPNTVHMCVDYAIHETINKGKYSIRML